MSDAVGFSETHFQWLDPEAFKGRLIVPRSNPREYEQQADLLFDTKRAANDWRDEELEAWADDPKELAYIIRWVLCRRTVEVVANDD